MGDSEKLKELFFEVLDHFGKLSLEIEQLRCLQRCEQSFNSTNSYAYSKYQCSLKDCLRFLEKRGEVSIVEEMRLLPHKVEEYTNGGLVPVSDRFLNDVFISVCIHLHMDEEGLLCLEASNDIQWNNTNIEGDIYHSFYLIDMNETNAISDSVPNDKIDLIVDELKTALSKPEFSLLKSMADIKAKIAPKKKENENPLDYPYVVLDYFPSLFEVDLFREIDDKVTFGKINGKAITWTILNVDYKENSYLLLADSILFKTYGKNISKSLEKCYSECFTKEEKARIIEYPRTTYLTPWKDNSISDKHLFLLSQLELFSMYQDGKDRMKFTKFGGKHCQCWLRESSECGYIVAAVTAYGRVTERFCSKLAGVRPALWMSAF